jgi:hypothetical protein
MRISNFILSTLLALGLGTPSGRAQSDTMVVHLDTIVIVPDGEVDGMLQRIRSAGYSRFFVQRGDVSESWQVLIDVGIERWENRRVVLERLSDRLNAAIICTLNERQSWMENCYVRNADGSGETNSVPKFEAPTHQLAKK